MSNDDQLLSLLSLEYITQHFPRVIPLLFIDQTKSNKKIQNIIWANDYYIHYGTKNYSATSPLTLDSIYRDGQIIIFPRALKSKEHQKERTKLKAEVFTPPWVVKKQIDAVDEAYKQDDLHTYIHRTWLEITCGEAPYIVSRYHMETGEFIAINERQGFLDRKLQRINQEIKDQTEWQQLIYTAYESSYGFEWNGDSLFLARQNLLYSFFDYYYDQWKSLPEDSMVERIATIISHNIFQMDGLKYIIPLSDESEEFIETSQPSLFPDLIPHQITKVGQRVKIMNWKKGKQEYFQAKRRN